MKMQDLLNELSAKNIPASQLAENQRILVRPVVTILPLVCEDAAGPYIEAESLQDSREIMLTLAINEDGKVTQLAEELEDHPIPKALAEADVSNIADRFLAFHDLLNPEEGQTADPVAISAFWGLPVR